MGIAERHKWAGFANQDDRRQARKDINLEDIGITASTLERYTIQLSRAWFLTLTRWTPKLA